MTTRKKPLLPPLSPGLTRAALYARVSTQQQADQDTSIPAQLAEGRKRLYAEGWLAGPEFTDPGCTGTSMDRPGLQAMLAAARRREFEVLIIHKSDRLSREEMDFLVIKAELAQHGVRIASVTEPFVGGSHPMDEMMETLARGFNKLYISNLRAEVHKRLRANAEAGYANGWPPYGYRWADLSKRRSGWAVDERDAPWALYLFARFSEGGIAFAALARELNARGVPPPTASADVAHRMPHAAASGWVPWTIKKILASRLYRGEIHYQGAWLPGAHPALVDAGTFVRVQALLAAHAPARAAASPRLFSGGLLRCPLCLAAGRGLVPLHVNFYTARLASDREAGTRTRYVSYRCKIEKRARQYSQWGGVFGESCPGYQISERACEGLLLEWLESEAGESGAGPPADPGSPGAPEPARRVADERKALDREALALPGLRRGYQDQQAAGAMTMPELLERLETLAAREAVLAEALATLPGGADSQAQAAQAQAAQARALRDLLLGDATAQQKRAQLAAAIRYILPAPDKRSLSIVLQG
jgi:DNA invertase Pin-like site-specific DNA recombinase